MDVHEETAARKLLDAVAEMLGVQRFELWLGSETGVRFEERKVALAVKNDFAAKWVRSNLARDIERVCQDRLGGQRSVEIVVLKQGEAGFVHPYVEKATEPARILEPVGVVSGSHGLNDPVGPVESQKVPGVQPSIPRPNSPLQMPAAGFTTGVGNPRAASETPGRRFASLETFVEGVSNRLACRAADLAVNHPGEINPIYIYGPSSVGKTHLLEGIWTAVRRDRGRKPPLYITAEQFIAAFMECLQSGSSRDAIQKFRRRFQNVSTLLIDDIQYLVRAAATQVELLNAIDTLCREGVQLVLTGDRPPGGLKGLRSEIVDRLGAGVVCAIEHPEREMSLQILCNMVAQRKLPIGMDVCRMVASRLGTHARQLSGALNRLHAVYLGTGQPITLALAEENLADLIRQNRRDIRLPDIERAVCDAFGLSEDALQSKSRAKHISTPRMLAMWLARKYTRSALSEIGRYFGDRTHSSVVSAQKKVDRWIDADHPIHGDAKELPISETIRNIERRLQSCAE